MTAPRSRWARIGRIATGLFLLVVAALLLRYARSVDWREVAQVLAAYEAPALFGAGLLAAGSFGLYMAYDLAARRFTGHTVPALRTMEIAFVTYAVSLNLGALIGGGGFRLRLYSREGLRPGLIGRIVGFSVTTNWLGYIALAGVLFASGAMQLPDGLAGYRGALRWLGFGMLAVGLAYLVACAAYHGRRWHVRGHVFHLPTLPLALLQFLLACTNWLLIAGILHVLLPGPVPYPTVLGVLLLSGIAAAMVHVPAGLGVMEAVFIGMLGHRLDEEALLAALLASRAIYYLAPLLPAPLLSLKLEARAGRARTRAPRPPPPHDGAPP